MAVARVFRQHHVGYQIQVFRERETGSELAGEWTIPDGTTLTASQILASQDGVIYVFELKKRRPADRNLDTTFYVYWAAWQKPMQLICEFDREYDAGDVYRGMTYDVRLTEGYRKVAVTLFDAARVTLKYIILHRTRTGFVMDRYGILDMARPTNYSLRESLFLREDGTLVMHSLAQSAIVLVDTHAQTYRAIQYLPYPQYPAWYGVIQIKYAGRYVYIIRDLKPLIVVDLATSQAKEVDIWAEKGFEIIQQDKRNEVVSKTFRNLAYDPFSNILELGGFILFKHITKVSDFSYEYPAFLVGENLNTLRTLLTKIALVEYYEEDTYKLLSSLVAVNPDIFPLMLAKMRDLSKAVMARKDDTANVSDAIDVITVMPPLPDYISLPMYPTVIEELINSYLHP